MKSFRELFEEARLAESGMLVPPTRAELKSRKVVEREHKKAGKPRDLLCELSTLGVVKNLQAERGYGFVALPDGGDELFFHVTDSRSRLDNLAGAVAPGDLICLVRGSSVRKPGMPCAVRWARLSDMDWSANPPPESQAQLDEFRRLALRNMPLDWLRQMIAADWYVQRWRGNAPADLVDNVLAEVLLDRAAELDPAQLGAARIGDVLRRSRYAFAAKLDTADPHCDVARLLTAFSPGQLAVFGVPDKGWLGNVSTAQKPILLEWMLLTAATAGLNDDHRGWLRGQTKYEAAVAERLLLGNTTLTDAALPWACGLAKKGWLAAPAVDQLAVQRPVYAATLMAWMSEAARRDHLAKWRRTPDALTAALAEDPSAGVTIAAGMTLAVDLETDGERIWEVGCARGEQAELLYSDASGTDLAGALRVLAARIGEVSLVVGHNILVWDWPILARELKLDRPQLIWDTLLVQYLLEPSARSHALGAAHHADDDARAALDLFSKQLQRLPASFVSQLLLGAFHDVRQLLDGIVMALGDGVALARSLPADWLSTDGEVGSVVLLPEHRLHDVDWVPGVVVVHADPDDRLPVPLWQIDGERLEQELAASGFDSPAAQVLLAVMWMAQAQGIVLRRNMIPLWLADSAPALAAAIDRAGVMPAAGSARCVSPLPSSEKWWAQADPSRCRVAWEGDGALIVGRRRMATADVGQLLGVPHPAQLMCIKEQAGSLWLRADRAAGMLDQRGGWSAFRAIPVAAAHRLSLPHVESLAKSSLVLATRHERVLYPGTLDQATYWREVLRTFREVRRTVRGTVPILLMASSSSGELAALLATGLAEVELAEVCPEHRSRREHLRRAARRDFALVDSIDHWPAWQALAESAGVSLTPVVEALPLEEWYAATYLDGPPMEANGSAGTDMTVAPPTTGSVARAVPVAALLAALPGLVKQHLAGWLQVSGLASVVGAIWIIDPRAGNAAFDLRGHMEHRAVDGTAWSSAERSRLDVVLAPLQVERETAPADYASMERFLVEHWQRGQGQNAVSKFKDSQKSAMEAICARASDVLVPLPTGEGKSVLFQVPALCRGLRNRRLTLVISPLKALMKDQVERLREQGFAESADYLSGDLTPYEREEVLQGVLDHRIVLLYLAPERFRSPAFLDVLRRRIESDGGLEHVVVDEAHCVNQWGYEFRPDYFHMAEYLLRTLRGEDEGEPSPFLLLSATVTASDRERLTAVLAAHPSRQLTNQLLVRPDTFTNPLRAHIAVTPQRVHGQINDKQGFPQAVEERLPAIIDAIGAARSNRQATAQRSAVIIFVAWRTQAEDLAALLATRTGEGVDYYHAGLDAATRGEIYMRFREGELDVLVATKAFGMGMDIPDIHWVLHLGPPSYLEDYLQEVGRIGRGEAERKRAGLERLSAILLYSNADFESNRVMRAQSALQLPQIREIHQKVAEHADDLAGQRIAFVPQHGYEPYKTEGEKRANATRVRMSLYWLERAGTVQLHGVVADLLAIDIEWSRLRKTAEEESMLGAVARTILSLDEQKSGVAPGADAEQVGAATTSDWLSRAIDALKSAAGFLFGAPSTNASAHSREHVHPASQPSAERCAALINLSQIRLRCRIKTMSEVMACLADLEKRGDVSLRWTLGFVGRTLIGEPSSRVRSLFDAVGTAVDNLIGRLSRRERVEFNPDELLDDARIIEGIDGLSPEEVEKLRKRYRRAWLHGFRSQARASGLRMRQLVRKDEHLVWEAMLPSTKRNAARQRNVYLLKAAQSLFELFKRNLDAGMSAVSVPELIRAMQAGDPNGRFHRKDLKPLLNLLAVMSLVSASPDTLPLSHVVVLPESAPPLDSHAALWQELKQVNDLAEVRVQAMEVFINLPDDDARDKFIEGYFAQGDAEGLRAFLDAQLGEIDDAGDEDLSGFIFAKREQLRATKVVEFFKRYEASEEPNQWKAIQYPFDRHLLVNAGPGAGKTAVLVGRIVHLIREQQIKPAEIVVLAFNRAVVFEIRKRIRELFTSLGFGSYVRRVRVSTFHSLAMRSLARAGEPVDRGRTENLLGDFAGKLSSDARFREQVAGGCRCILIDEFQDVTEDVYATIRNLHLGSGSRAGVMAIGDDDQDILRWQRKKNREKSEFAESFFTRFRSDFSGDEPAYLELGVNFRSRKEIVERSQKAIAGFFERNSQSSRLKENQLRPRHGADDRSSVEWLNWKDKSWDEALEHVVGACRKLREVSPGSLAVLCRSNAEVAEAHHKLAGEIPGLVVQGGANLRVADLRHVALWVDFLERAMATRDGVLTDLLKAELLEAFQRKTDIPETRSSMESTVSLANLWNLCCQEHTFPHLSTLVRFIRDLQSDELERLLGAGRGGSHAVVSTIHKVKGLEFDNVIVLPSGSSFPYGDGVTGRGLDSASDSLERDAAEEARLLYVAMTRAKTRLVYFAGDREYTWAKPAPEPYSGAQGTGLVLSGLHEDVWLSWAYERNYLNRDPDGCQAYIEKNVRVGDRLTLVRAGDRTSTALTHQDASGKARQIGFLAKKRGEGCQDASLEVSAVVRFALKPEDLAKESLADTVRHRGWGYVVLVSGRLR